MIPVDFIYDDEWLSNYDMVTLQPNDGQSFVSRNIERSDINTNRPVPFHYGVAYSDVLTLNFFIGRYINNNIVRLNEEEINDIRSWLESPKTPKKLTVITTASEEDTIIFYGLFTDIQPYVVSGSYYGLYLTFTCDSPYGYTEDYETEYEIRSSGDTEGYFYNNSAERYEYLMPKIIIQSSSSFGINESLSIKNVSDKNKTMQFTLPQGKTKLIIDCKEKIITDENGTLISLGTLGYINDDSYTQFINLLNMYWLSLIYGVNNLIFTPSSGHTINKIIISTKFIVKLGGF